MMATVWQRHYDVFADSMKRLEQWVSAEFGPDWDIERKRTHQFVISKTRV